MNKLATTILCVLASLLPAYSHNVTEMAIPEYYDHHHAQASLGLFQGDIKIFDEFDAHGNTRGYNANRTRNLGGQELLKWDNWLKNDYYWIRVYIDNSDFNQVQTSTIIDALRKLQWTGKVIKFQFLTNKPGSSYSNPYIWVKNDGQGCSSYYGRIPTAAKGQALSLESRCLTTRTIHHVFFHALGFAHEINRPDRDNYIDIFEDNIMPGKLVEFAKFEDVDALGLPFDYMSAMMYSENTFATRSWYKTIASSTNQQISQRESGATWWDYMKIILMYQCVTNDGAQSRTLQQYKSQKCDDSCKCWKKSAGCNAGGGDSWCKGNLKCRRNVCLP